MYGDEKGQRAVGRAESSLAGLVAVGGELIGEGLREICSGRGGGEENRAVRRVQER